MDAVAVGVPLGLLMGWSRRAEGRARQMHLMRDLVQMHKSVLFLSYDTVRQFGRRQRINVWWQGAAATRT
ncbi:hypothetical protein HC928_22675 [bacterium]|nr:hypothetical protein [bacterium]